MKSVGKLQGYTSDLKNNMPSLFRGGVRDGLKEVKALSETFLSDKNCKALPKEKLSEYVGQSKAGKEELMLNAVRHRMEVVAASRNQE
ncbi:hypothetical protein PflCFBP13517_25730 [Pseudomonas fluorescens]|nr:hypothetical protein PflCFBP13517_25730 [Pseudomonas fluorescens]